jgi:Beta-lactamase superfamily domain
VAFRMTLTGVGAMNSPRFAPAGLLIEHDGAHVLIDGGRDSGGDVDLDAWLVTDDRSELIREVRLAARARGLEAGVGQFSSPHLTVDPLPVTHTSHDTYGYLIQAGQCRIVWAPEFYVFPEWAGGCDLMFAEAAAWDRPIHFAGKAGGHASALDVAREAQARHVERLVFAHIGRPTIRAMDRGLKPRFGEYGRDGARFDPRRWKR